MTTKQPNVMPHDGSLNLGGPRPPVPERPAKPPAEAKTPSRFGGAYADRSYVGVRDERAAFDAAQGTPSPRALAQRSGPEAIGMTHIEPGNEDELIKRAAPLT
jgi:hypothetical protein